MLRTFTTHELRRETELTGLWRFTPLDGPRAGLPIQAMVPGCWESLPGFENYRGAADYETTFEAGGAVRLVFKGISHTAAVFVDGEEVATHYGAYTPFAVALPGLAPGPHHLRVRVGNAFGEASALHVPNDYHSYGGISRPVAVQQVADCFIEAVHARPVRTDDGWALALRVRVRNLGGAAHTVDIACVAGDNGTAFEPKTLAAGETAVFEGILPCPGALSWQPDAPVLYRVKATLAADGAVCDDLIDRVGFREVRVKGSRIVLNGTPLAIRGFNRHEDHPQFGCALPLEAMQADLALMRDLGANAVRTSHYPNDERFLDLCDEQGFLVWEEGHARGLSLAQMQNPNFDAQSEACLREMVDSHYNHPCVFIWGVLNECASDTEAGRAIYAKQLGLLRRLDPARPVSFASCRFKTDICFGLVDVVSFNGYPRWYHDRPAAEYFEALAAWIQATGGAGKPVLITEVGAGGIYGNRSPARLKWSEERQADILDEQLSAILARADLSGVFIWQFCDVRVSEEWFATRPRTMNNKGVVDEYRRPKLAYETVKRHFGGGAG